MPLSAQLKNLPSIEQPLSQSHTPAPSVQLMPPAKVSKALGMQSIRQLIPCFMYVFFCFLRMGEVVTPTSTSYDPTTHLCFGDVRLDNYENPQFLEVRIMTHFARVYLCIWGHVILPVPSGSNFKLYDYERHQARPFLCLIRQKISNLG